MIQTIKSTTNFPSYVFISEVGRVGMEVISFERIYIYVQVDLSENLRDLEIF